MAIPQRISAMLFACADECPPFPPTILYNEGWMLRLCMDWFSQHKEVQGHPLSVPESGRWFSEGLIRSAFLPRKQGDKAAEGYTHADGVIGDFYIREGTKSGVSLRDDAKHFVIAEAKMSSGLSKGTANIKQYNQAARNVACIASLLAHHEIPPETMTTLGFYVLAPQRKLDEMSDGGVSILDKCSIRDAVQDRLTAFDGDARIEASSWFDKSFLPVLERTSIASVSWEDVVAFIAQRDSAAGAELQEFYRRALVFNARTTRVSGERGHE